MEVADVSFDRAEQILGRREGDAVLVHSDFWLKNILVDPRSYRITGVIDPLDAEWADRELDLIHLELSWGSDMRLIELYKQQIGLHERFPLRYAFYQFWYAMQNFARIGWHDREQDLKLASALREAIGRYR
jgi:fructosamine-3-kinase